MIEEIERYALQQAKAEVGHLDGAIGSVEVQIQRRQAEIVEELEEQLRQLHDGYEALIKELKNREATGELDLPEMKEGETLKEQDLAHPSSGPLRLDGIVEPGKMIFKP